EPVEKPSGAHPAPPAATSGSGGPRVQCRGALSGSLERVPDGHSVDVQGVDDRALLELVGQHLPLDRVREARQRLTTQGILARPAHANAVRDLEAGALADVLEQADQLPREALLLELP